jgi:hypothetical protein
MQHDPPGLTVTDLPPKMDAMLAMMAAAQSEDDARLRSMAARLPGLVRRLNKFSFPKVMQPLAGLLTVPENHPANLRLASLIHLAALYCNGDKSPSLAQLREWLNDIILKDPIAQREDPVEDVCVSNAITWFGNARLFDGGWQDNDYGLQGLLVAIVKLREEAWMKPVARSVRALLNMSEAIAERASVPRFTLSKSPPCEPLRVSQTIVGAVSEYVTFTPAQLAGMGIARADLTPFEFTPDQRQAMANETIGHTALERRPVVFSEGRILLALPTAVSAALRRFVMESAVAAGRLSAVQEILTRYQFEEVRFIGRPGWEIRPLDPPESPGDHEFIGQFDEGGYVHVVFIPDSLEQILKDGLQSVDSIPDKMTARLDAVAAEIAKRPDYQRGITLIVHGGTGRGFFAGFGEPPPEWQRLILSGADFMSLAWDNEMDALRAWKLLDQEDELRKRDVEFVNANGFMNLYGYAASENYELVPNAMAKGIMVLQTNHLTAVRHSLRTSVDRHAALMTLTPGYLAVQRQTTGGYFNEVKNLPIYISAEHAASAELVGCVETAARPWWVRCHELPDDARAISVVYQVWELVQNWLVRTAPALEATLPALRAGPVVIWLSFPKIAEFISRQGEIIDPPVQPVVTIDNDEIHIACSVEYLHSFASERNIGDKFMVVAVIQGAHALAGVAQNDEAREAMIAQIVKTDQQRFFHAVPAAKPRDRLFSAVSEPRPRFVQPEDRARSWLNLARDAGWTNASGPVPNDQARRLLNDAVNVAWLRTKERLLTLERSSVIERALRNDYAIYRDRATWQLTAAALLSLYNDQADVVAAANLREGQRGLAALASRVVAEMAICVSPVSKGKSCSKAEFDFLVANVAILLECASQSDAFYYDLASSQLTVQPNGTFTFDSTFYETLHRPYIHSHGERGFRAAAADYGTPFALRDNEVKPIDSEFEAAFVEEFGLTPPQLSQFTYRLSDIAVREGSPTFRLRRSEVVDQLRKVSVKDADRAYDALSLGPRARWDDPRPARAKSRDWYPWRFNRRLSLTRRPLVQIDEAGDPNVLIAPALLDRSVEYLYGTYQGRLPEDLFESERMKKWIGKAVNADGHAFNHAVAGAFRDLGFGARTDLKMTELGGTPVLGDVDALAWNPKHEVVYAAECKRLLFARTVGEVGERLREYTSVATRGGDRTPIQKHLDRMTFLRSALPALSKLTGIAADKIKLRSALVTDYLVPMQFSKKASQLVDVVTDIDLLESAVGDQEKA